MMPELVRIFKIDATQMKCNAVITRLIIIWSYMKIIAKAGRKLNIQPKSHRLRDLVIAPSDSDVTLQDMGKCGD